MLDRTAFHKFSYGMYIVGSRNGERINAQIANTAFQVTSEPPQIAIAINTENLTHEFIRKSRVFSVSVLSSETPLDFIGNFGFTTGRNYDKFQALKKGVDYILGDVTGSPVVLKNAVAVLEAEVTYSLKLESHTLFIGRVVSARNLNSGEVLTYERYRAIKNGATPARAPTYNPEPETAIKTLSEPISESASRKTGEVVNVTEVRQVYRCKICGNIVEVLHAAGGTLVCCGQPMELLEGNTTEASVEKHLPVIEKTKEGVKIKVGSAPHPMEEKHYIEWIELVADGEIFIKWLKPGDKPEAEFSVKAKKISARAYCNLHGLWKKE